MPQKEGEGVGPDGRPGFSSPSLREVEQQQQQHNQRLKLHHNLLTVTAELPRRRISSARLGVIRPNGLLNGADATVAQLDTERRPRSHGRPAAATPVCVCVHV